MVNATLLPILFGRPTIVSTWPTFNAASLAVHLVFGAVAGVIGRWWLSRAPAADGGWT